MYPFWSTKKNQVLDAKLIVKEGKSVALNRLVENDDLIHCLLLVEGALLGLGSSRTEKDCSRFAKSKNLLDMIQNRSCSIVEIEVWRRGGEGVLDLQQIKEDLFNHIVWATRIRRPWSFLFDCT